MKKVLIILSIVFVVGALAGSALAWYVYKSGSVQRFLIEKVAEGLAPKELDKAAVRRALGYEGKRTYLLLFLNNTELRPGGGFIGAYGVVDFVNGVPSIEKIEGTEIIDNQAPQDAALPPPLPLATYLKIKRWQFRDSNWSPDFPTSVSTSLYLYNIEKGVGSDHIDGVIGFTPTILEELLKITGPVETGGQTYNTANATEQLEYAVEYGYAEHGYTFRDRKQTLINLAHALFDKIRFDIFSHWSAYTELVPRMLAGRQIMLYSAHPDEEAVIVNHDWGGVMKKPTADYLLWADANLGALKTDASIDRNLTYSLVPSSSSYIATVTMHYNHQGTFNWRTTRYLDYARIFVPSGSTFIGVEGGMDGSPTAKVETVEQGSENGYNWFGGFIKIEPGHTGHLTFTYKVSPEVAQAIEQGQYNLLVQKQLGTYAPQLTLQLDFGKNLSSAEPSEDKSHYGDKRYDLTTDLSVDREFKIGLGN